MTIINDNRRVGMRTSKTTTIEKNSNASTVEGYLVELGTSYPGTGRRELSKPYSDPSFKGGKLVDTWVAHISGDNVTGTGAAKLASKPDSVVMRYRFSGTRAH